MKRKKQPSGFRRKDDDPKIIFQTNTKQTTLSDKSKQKKKPTPKLVIYDVLTGVKVSEEEIAVSEKSAEVSKT